MSWDKLMNGPRILPSNPVMNRANMIINQFTGVFDDNAENWEEEMRSEKFFARYLGGAAQSEVDLTDEEFERVMIEGKRAAGILE